MSNIFFILTVIAALLVLASLFAGVFVMAKGGETDKKYSNKLMRLRIYLQGLAVLLMAIALMLSGNN